MPKQQYPISVTFAGGAYDALLRISGERSGSIKPSAINAMLALVQREMATAVIPMASRLISPTATGQSTALQTFASGTVRDLKVTVHINLTVDAEGVAANLRRVLAHGLVELHQLIDLATPTAAPPDSTNELVRATTFCAMVASPQLYDPPSPLHDMPAPVFRHLRRRCDSSRFGMSPASPPQGEVNDLHD